MTGQQTVDAIHAHAQRQFRDHAVSVMHSEIEQLRAKVIEQHVVLQDTTFLLASACLLLPHGASREKALQAVERARCVLAEATPVGSPA